MVNLTRQLQGVTMILDMCQQCTALGVVEEEIHAGNASEYYLRCPSCATRWTCWENNE